MKTGYLSTAEVSRMLKVNDSTVKRWTDKGNLKCIKTVGGHRKYRMQDVVAFMDTFNYDTTETIIPAEKKFTKITVSTDYAILAKDFKTLSDIFFNIVLKGNREDTFQFLNLLYVNRFSFVDITDKVIFPAFRTIGEQWMVRQLTVEQEHLASNTAMHAVMKLHDNVHKKQKNGFIALTSCLENEYHELGLLCAANLLESNGWTVYTLGANVPTDSIINAIETYQPKLVLLSSTVPKSKKFLLESVRAIHHATQNMGAHLSIGGYAATSTVRTKIEAEHIAGSMHELLNFAESILTTTDTH